MNANKLKVGETGTIKEINFDDRIQHHRMLDLGFLPETKIRCYAKTFGSTAFIVKGGMFGLRNEDAENIILEK